ncbi:unnamed protein product [Bursaphelenchus okinawaensis]|uniref:Palmitoyltransferase n=1 Tax=Bursaphelenchus okinawaensis TaxID=465554 RepID=A0A811JQJ5_9BILA|nr:unnamed protein product [Bursaphelenchus okinawaensis]CAG9078347.1 unnamed protein product [Bursaphelenchus okinawaensis]
MRIDFYAEPGATPEKLLVEVQGTIHPPVDPIGKSVFFLYWQSPTTAICLIDHHMMEGSLKTLEQPYLVVDTKSTTKQSEGMSKLNDCGIHPSWVFIGTLLFVIYVPFFAVVFTWTYSTAYKIYVGIPFFVISVLAFSSLTYTLLLPYPELPDKLKLDPDFFEWSQEEKYEFVKKRVEEIGANWAHIRAVCGTCKIIKTERTHHCAICDICTPRLDHHCCSLDRCIHYGNQKTFILFFVYLLAFLYLYFAANIPLMKSFGEEYAKHSDKGEVSWPLYLIVWILVPGPRLSGMVQIYFGIVQIAVLVILCVFSVVSCAYIYYAVYCNCTIAACNQAVDLIKQFPFFKMNDTYQVCFKKNGIIANFEVIFGPFGFGWLYPWQTNEDGWIHECSCEQNWDGKMISIRTGTQYNDDISDENESEDEDSEDMEDREVSEGTAERGEAGGLKEGNYEYVEGRGELDSKESDSEDGKHGNDSEETKDSDEMKEKESEDTQDRGESKDSNEGAFDSEQNCGYSEGALDGKQPEVQTENEAETFKNW